MRVFDGRVPGYGRQSSLTLFISFKEQGYSSERKQLCVLDKVFSQFKQAHEQEPIMSLVQRKQALLALKHALLDAQEPLIAAASEDFGYRERFDTLVSDILPTIEALDYCRKNLLNGLNRKAPGGFAHFPRHYTYIMRPKAWWALYRL